MLYFTQLSLLKYFESLAAMRIRESPSSEHAFEERKSSSERPPSPVWGDGPSEAPPTADPEPSGNWDTGDAGSPESILDPPNPNFYPESEIIGSYEVATNTEIYRISTIPDDFIGYSNEVDWPRALKAGHTDYKLVQKVLEAAEVNLRSAAIDGPADPLTMVDRCEAVYYAAYNAGGLLEVLAQRVWLCRKPSWPCALE